MNDKEQDNPILLLALLARAYRTTPAVVEEAVAGLQIVTYSVMPSLEEAPEPSEAHRHIDVVFFTVVVDMDAARAKRADVAELIRDVGKLLAADGLTTLGDGPSYIHLGAVLGSQDVALMLMAVGEALGFWTIQTVVPRRSWGEIDRGTLLEAAMAGYLFVLPPTREAAAS